MVTILQGDCLEVLPTLEEESVHTVITSPPYLWLRDYGTAGQIGLEPSIDAYVAKMVEVFRAVWRVLRADGTLWLNLGDSYNAYNGGAGPGSKLSQTQSAARPRLATGHGLQSKALKPKDLMMVPARVAIALQADGWYLRSDIIFAKPNPMPESVTDRPTRSHEYVFLLTKSARYFYDADAVREPNVRLWDESNGGSWAHASRSDEDALTKGKAGVHRGKGYPLPNPAGRNKRSVWTIATESYSEAHFATFPKALVTPCLLAGTSARGVCGTCGTPWVRQVEREPGFKAREQEIGGGMVRRTGKALDADYRGIGCFRGETTGWSPSCSCAAGEPVPATVLDCFAGSGTVGEVALLHGRKAVLIELSPAYCELARQRVDGTQLPLDLAL